MKSNRLLMFASVMAAAFAASQAGAAGAVSAPMSISTCADKPATFDPRTRFATALDAKDWAGVEEAFKATSDSQDDATAALQIRRAFGPMRQAKQYARLEAMANHVLAKHATDRPKTAYLASSIWLMCGAASKQGPRCLPGRLETLLAAKKLSPEKMSLLFCQCFYADTADTNNIKRLCETGKKILDYGHGDTNVGQIVTMRFLDACFLCREFDRAVSIVSAGIPGKDAAWHRGILPKVKAHANLAHGQYKEAIANFRAFMAASLMDPATKDEVDPMTGVGYCREWILARNENRIANIYRDNLKDETSFTKCRAAARRYFQTALGKTVGPKHAAARRLLEKEIRDDGFADLLK